jgi:hypothetical protein
MLGEGENSGGVLEEGAREGFMSPLTHDFSLPNDRRCATPKPEPEDQSEISFWDSLDVAHDVDAPLKIRKMADLIGSAPSPGQAARSVHRELYFATGEEPATFREVEKEEAWRQAMSEEIKSIEENNS